MRHQPNDENQPLSLEECQELARIMNIKYAATLKGRCFELTVQSDEDTAEVKVLLSNRDQSFYYPVEGRIELRQQDLSQRDGALFIIDYIDTYFDEYLREDEDVFLPIDWSSFRCEGFDFQMRGQIFNLKAEALADKLLAEGSGVPLAERLP